MASQSAPPPSSADGKPPLTTAVEGSALPANEVSKDSKEELTQCSPPSVFVNTEPIREDQVQNAVKFLSHPKVRGSPVMYRRSFLERKGLTKEEIDEAFRLVPDSPPSTQATTTAQEGQGKTTAYIQPQAQARNLQPATAVSTAVVPTPRASVWSRFHWYHAVIAVGVLTASGAGTAVLVKNAIIPRLKSWIRRIALEEQDEGESLEKSNRKPSLAEETAAAAKAAAVAAADLAKASQEIVNSRHEERRTFEELMNLLYHQANEMKSMIASIQKSEAANIHERFPAYEQEDYRLPVTNSKQTYVNGKKNFDTRSGRSSSPPASIAPTAAPHSKSYMEIMEMVQRGEKPSNIREIDDRPPNPYQQFSDPRVAPKAKPWAGAQIQYGSQVLQSQHSSEGLNSDIEDNGKAYPSNIGNAAVPWWQQKKPRITEIDGDDESKVEPYGRDASEQPFKQTWVPPQPPPVAMPEAAEAIRRPKQKAQTEDDQILSQSTEISDELQRARKISESGGVSELNGDGSATKISEIRGVSEVNGNGSATNPSEIPEAQEQSFSGN